MPVATTPFFQIGENAAMKSPTRPNRLAPLLVLAMLAVLGCSSEVPVPDGVPTAAYLGGNWWNGESFESRTVYVVGGTLGFRPPSRIDREVALAGGWVVPPFGEAHAHHFEAPGLSKAMNAQLLKQGVFYGMSLTNWADMKEELLPFYERAETIDVAFADLGLTASYGHPIMIYENLARQRFDFDATEVELFHDRRAEGRAYLIFDSVDDVDAKWPEVIASRPDLLKIFLFITERWEEIARDTTRLGGGLHPEVARALVARAHKEGLRVSAHVETAHDFRLAVEMGVDIIAHLPGYQVGRHDSEDVPELYRVRAADGRISAADAELAAERGVIVIPTPISPPRGADMREEALAFFTEQLGTLRDAGVVMAIGSDAFGGTPLGEVTTLASLNVFSNEELLEMWGRNTARAIFPDRRVGRLTPGHEASFLVLACDPVTDFDCVQDIRLRVKAGRVLDPSSPE